MIYESGFVLLLVHDYECGFVLELVHDVWNVIFLELIYDLWQWIWWKFDNPPQVIGLLAVGVGRSGYLDHLHAQPNWLSWLRSIPRDFDHVRRGKFFCVCQFVWNYPIKVGVCQHWLINSKDDWRIIVGLYPPFSPHTWTFSQNWWTCTYLKECAYNVYCKALQHSLCHNGRE